MNIRKGDKSRHVRYIQQMSKVISPCNPALTVSTICICNFAYNTLAAHIQNFHPLYYYYYYYYCYHRHRQHKSAELCRSMCRRNLIK